MARTYTYEQRMGRLGYLQANPQKKPKPGELDRLADSYLTQGRKGNRATTGWLTTRQMKTRMVREANPGVNPLRIFQVHGEWIARACPLPRR